jgi:hypothetical protein
MHEEADARPSAVSEHHGVAIRDHADANAPGRSEVSREHTSLAITQRRDERHGLCSVAIATTPTRTCLVGPRAVASTRTS